MALSMLAQDFSLAAEIRFAVPASLSVPAFPKSIAVVEKISAGASDQPIIYLLRDAHVNESAQRNLSAVLQTLQQSKTNLVFLEGGWGDLSLSPLAAGASASKRRSVAERFLKKGWIQGADYADLISEKPLTLVGAEDKKLYAEGVELYRSVSKNRERALAWLDLSDRLHEFLKSRLYSPDLAALDEKRRLHREESGSYFEYLQALLKAAERHALPVERFSALSRAAALKKSEEVLNFEAANREQAAALGALGPDERAEMASWAAAQKRDAFFFGSTGHEGDGGYFALLAEKIASRKKDYPNLTAYLDYLESARKFRWEDLLTETQVLEDAVFSALTRSEDERQLIGSGRVLESLRALFSLKLDEAQWRAIQADPQSFDPQEQAAFLNSKILDLGTRHEFALFWEKEIGDIFSDARRFYENSEARDERFVETLLAETRKRGESRAALVAGGFHTARLEAMLEKRRVPFVSIRPQVYAETNQKRYESLLLSGASSASKSGPSTIAVRTGAQLRVPQGSVRTLLEEAFNGSRLASPANASLVKTHPLRSSGPMSATVEKPKIRFALLWNAALVWILGKFTGQGGNAEWFRDFRNISAPPKHILFVFDVRSDEGAIGDGLLIYAPVIRALLKIFPETKITLATRRPEVWKNFDARFKAVPRGEVLAMDADETEFAQTFFRAKSALGFDGIVDLSSSRSAVVQNLLESATPGFFFASDHGNGSYLRTNDKRETRKILPLQLELFFIPETYRSVVRDSMARFYRTATGEEMPPMGDTLFDSGDTDTELLEKWMPRRERPYLLLNIFSSTARKDWTDTGELSGFVERMTARGFHVVLPSANKPAEREFLENLERVVSPAAAEHTTFVSDAMTLQSLLAMVQRSDAVVTVDTSVSHWAEEFGKPVTVLFHAPHAGWRFILRMVFNPHLAWNPSAEVRKHREYVVTRQEGHYDPGKVEATFVRQANRRGIQEGARLSAVEARDSNSKYIWSGFLHRSFEVPENILSPENPFTVRFLNLIDKNQSLFKGKKVLDLGTGSGVLAVALARAGAHVVASDISADAVGAARRNADAEPREIAARIRTVQSDLYDEIGESDFDFIVFNNLIYNGLSDARFPETLITHAGYDFLVNRRAIREASKVLSSDGRLFMWALRVAEEALHIDANAYENVWDQRRLEETLAGKGHIEIAPNTDPENWVPGDSYTEALIYSIEPPPGARLPLVDSADALLNALKRPADGSIPQKSEFGPFPQNENARYRGINGIAGILTAIRTGYVETHAPQTWGGTYWGADFGEILRRYALKLESASEGMIVEIAPETARDFGLDGRRTTKRGVPLNHVSRAWLAKKSADGQVYSWIEVTLPGMVSTKGARLAVSPLAKSSLQKAALLSVMVLASSLWFHAGQNPLTILPDVLLRFASVFSGILWSKNRADGMEASLSEFLRVMFRPSTEQERENRLSALRWGGSISIVGGYFFYTVVVPFLTAAVPAEISVIALPIGPLAVDMRPLLDIGSWNGILHLPLNLSLAVVFGEDKNVQEKSFFKRLWGVYSALLAVHFLFWYPLNWSVWKLFGGGLSIKVASALMNAFWLGKMSQTINSQFGGKGSVSQGKKWLQVGAQALGLSAIAFAWVATVQMFWTDSQLFSKFLWVTGEGWILIVGTHLSGYWFGSAADLVARSSSAKKVSGARLAHPGATGYATLYREFMMQLQRTWPHESMGIFSFLGNAFRIYTREQVKPLDPSLPFDGDIINEALGLATRFVWMSPGQLEGVWSMVDQSSQWADLKATYPKAEEAIKAGRLMMSRAHASLLRRGRAIGKSANEKWSAWTRDLAAEFLTRRSANDPLYEELFSRIEDEIAMDEEELAAWNGLSNALWSHRFQSTSDDEDRRKYPARITARTPLIAMALYLMHESDHRIIRESEWEDLRSLITLYNALPDIPFQISLGSLFALAVSPAIYNHDVFTRLHDKLLILPTDEERAAALGVEMFLAGAHREIANGDTAHDFLAYPGFTREAVRLLRENRLSETGHRRLLAGLVKLHAVLVPFLAGMTTEKMESVDGMTETLFQELREVAFEAEQVIREAHLPPDVNGAGFDMFERMRKFDPYIFGLRLNFFSWMEEFFYQIDADVLLEDILLDRQNSRANRQLLFAVLSAKVPNDGVQYLLELALIVWDRLMQSYADLHARSGARLSSPATSMQANAALEAFRRFETGEDTSGEGWAVTRSLLGHLNETYFLSSPSGREFVLQHINTIPDLGLIEANMREFERVQQAAFNQGLLPRAWQKLVYYDVAANASKIYIDASGRGWRLMNKLKGRSFQTPTEIPDAERREALRAYGETIALFRKVFEFGRWKTTFPNFHDTAYHIDYLDSVLADRVTPLNLSSDPSKTVRLNLDRLENDRARIDALLSGIQERRGRYASFLNSFNPAAAHNDFKIVNLLFEKIDGLWTPTGLIDLDTLQLSTEFEDPGDALRSVAPMGPKVPASLADVRIDTASMEALADGYASKIAELYGSVNARRFEENASALAGVFAFQMVVRYLADYLAGDAYFPVKPGERADINLYKAEIQMRILEQIEQWTPGARLAETSDLDPAGTLVSYLAQQAGLEPRFSANIYQLGEAFRAYSANQVLAAVRKLERLKLVESEMRRSDPANGRTTSRYYSLREGLYETPTQAVDEYRRKDAEAKAAAAASRTRHIAGFMRAYADRRIDQNKDVRKKLDELLKRSGSTVGAFFISLPSSSGILRGHFMAWARGRFGFSEEKLTILERGMNRFENGFSLAGAFRDVYLDLDFLKKRGAEITEIAGLIGATPGQTAHLLETKGDPESVALPARERILKRAENLHREVERLRGERPIKTSLISPLMPRSVLEALHGETAKVLVENYGKRSGVDSTEARKILEDLAEMQLKKVYSILQKQNGRATAGELFQKIKSEEGSESFLVVLGSAEILARGLLWLEQSGYAIRRSMDIKVHEYRWFVGGMAKKMHLDLNVEKWPPRLKRNWNRLSGQDSPTAVAQRIRLIFRANHLLLQSLSPSASSQLSALGKRAVDEYSESLARLGYETTVIAWSDKLGIEPVRLRTGHPRVLETAQILASAPSEFSKRLARFRMIEGLTHVDLAGLVGVNSKYIQRIETGSQRIENRPRLVSRIAEIFNTDPYYLYANKHAESFTSWPLSEQILNFRIVSGLNKHGMAELILNAMTPHKTPEKPSRTSVALYVARWEAGESPDYHYRPVLQTIFRSEGLIHTIPTALAGARLAGEAGTPDIRAIRTRNVQQAWATYHEKLVQRNLQVRTLLREYVDGGGSVAALAAQIGEESLPKDQIYGLLAGRHNLSEQRLQIVERAIVLDEKGVSESARLKEIHEKINELSALGVNGTQIGRLVGISPEPARGFMAGNGAWDSVIGETRKKLLRSGEKLGWELGRLTGENPLIDLPRRKTNSAPILDAAMAGFWPGHTARIAAAQKISEYEARKDLEDMGEIVFREAYQAIKASRRGLTAPEIRAQLTDFFKSANQLGDRAHFLKDESLENGLRFLEVRGFALRRIPDPKTMTYRWMVTGAAKDRFVDLRTDLWPGDLPARWKALGEAESPQAVEARIQMILEANYLRMSEVASPNVRNQLFKWRSDWLAISQGKNILSEKSFDASIIQWAERLGVEPIFLRTGVHRAEWEKRVSSGDLDALEFKDRLKKLREISGMTAVDLGGYAGIESKFIRRVENGDLTVKRRPTWVPRLSKPLHMDSYRFYSGKTVEEGMNLEWADKVHNLRMSRGLNTRQFAQLILDSMEEGNRNTEKAATTSVKHLIINWENGKTVPERSYRSAIDALYLKAAARLADTPLSRRLFAASTAAAVFAPETPAQDTIEGVVRENRALKVFFRNPFKNFIQRPTDANREAMLAAAGAIHAAPFEPALKAFAETFQKFRSDEEAVHKAWGTLLPFLESRFLTGFLMPSPSGSWGFALYEIEMREAYQFGSPDLLHVLYGRPVIQADVTERSAKTLSDYRTIIVDLEHLDEMAREIHSLRGGVQLDPLTNDAALESLRLRIRMYRETAYKHMSAEQIWHTERRALVVHELTHLITEILKTPFFEPPALANHPDWKNFTAHSRRNLLSELASYLSQIAAVPESHGFLNLSATLMATHGSWDEMHRLASWATVMLMADLPVKAGLHGVSSPQTILPQFNRVASASVAGGRWNSGPASLMAQKALTQISASFPDLSRIRPLLYVKTTLPNFRISPQWASYSSKGARLAGLLEDALRSAETTSGARLAGVTIDDAVERLRALLDEKFISDADKSGTPYPVTIHLNEFGWPLEVLDVDGETQGQQQGARVISIDAEYYVLSGHLKILGHGDDAVSLAVLRLYNQKFGLHDAAARKEQRYIEDLQDRAYRYGEMPDGTRFFLQALRAEQEGESYGPRSVRFALSDVDESGYPDVSKAIDWRVAFQADTDFSAWVDQLASAVQKGELRAFEEQSAGVQLPETVLIQLAENSPVRIHANSVEIALDIIGAPVFTGIRAESSGSVSVQMNIQGEQVLRHLTHESGLALLRALTDARPGFWSNTLKRELREAGVHSDYIRFFAQMFLGDSQFRHERHLRRRSDRSGARLANVTIDDAASQIDSILQSAVREAGVLSDRAENDGHPYPVTLVFDKVGMPFAVEGFNRPVPRGQRNYSAVRTLYDAFGKRLEVADRTAVSLRILAMIQLHNEKFSKPNPLNRDAQRKSENESRYALRTLEGPDGARFFLLVEKGLFSNQDPFERPQVRFTLYRVDEAGYPKEAGKISQTLEHSGEFYETVERIREDIQKGMREQYALIEDIADGVAQGAGSVPSADDQSEDSGARLANLNVYVGRAAESDQEFQISWSAGKIRSVSVGKMSGSAFSDFGHMTSAQERLLEPLPSGLASEGYAAVQISKQSELDQEGLIRLIHTAMAVQAAARVSGSGARLSEFFGEVERRARWSMQELPLAVEGKSHLFRLETVGGRRFAVAEGLAPVELVQAEKTGALGGASSDVTVMAKSLTEKVHSLLDAAGISNQKRVIVKLNADVLPESSFDRYAETFVAALKQAARRKYGQNVLFVAAGAKAEWLTALDPDAKVFARAVPADWSDAAQVLLDLPRVFEGRGVRVPVAALKEGDVPAFEAIVRLAIESGRIDPDSLSDGFEEAFNLLSGTRPGKVVLSKILTGAESLDVVQVHALKALQVVPISEVVRLFRLWKSQFEQSA